MSRRKLSDFAVLYAAFFLYSISSVFAKMAAGQDTLIKTGLFLAAEVTFLGIYALIWQQVLKRFPLVVAMSNKGVTVLFGLMWSLLIFKESITVCNIIGSFLVIAGVVLVSSDG